MVRNIETYLLEWKNSRKHKPLILRGARQVGKTFIVEKLGQHHFEHFANFNLELDNQLISIFESKQPQKIIDELNAVSSIPIIPGKTLLFIDEIQLSPSAIASLRYFYEQLPDLHVIATGSLLDHVLNEIQYSMPIGRVEYAYLYPLSFSEFLNAFGETGLCRAIDNYNIEDKFSQAIHAKISDYLRLYFYIGGMPEAVQTYLDTKNITEVEKVHASILTSLQFDFAKYGTRAQQGHLRSSLHYVANNIGHKVKYVNVDSQVHSSRLKEAFLKLEMSRIIHLVHSTKSSEAPITQYVNNNRFKPLFLDIGLVCHLAQIQYTNIKNPISDFAGALAEQFVGQEMIAASPFYKETKLYYWVREAKNSNAEIDYLFQKNNEIFPIEVKAGKSGTLKSLQVFLAAKHKAYGIRLNLEIPNLGHEFEATIRANNQTKKLSYSLLSMPIYFAGRLVDLNF